MCAGRLIGPLLLLSAASLPYARGDQHSITRSPHGDLKVACENCHTFTSWKPLRSAVEFDHDKTKFPLRGMHQGVYCTQCHVSLVFTNVGMKCADCHADIHRGQFGAECGSCHTVKGWQVSLRDVRGHQNRFPLLGAHAALACEDCHKGAANSQFTGLSTDCVACHKQDFVQTTLPNHVSARFPTTCESCHNMDSWSGASFDHGKFTGFVLTGVHATLDCTACHIGGSFQTAGASCINCHLKDFNATTNPNHAQAGFPQDCGLCHSTSSWTKATFNHNAFTTFPLTGAHVNVPCTSCHVNGQFAGTPTNCASCHLRDFQKTTNPNHVTAGFPQDCSQCHSTASWTATSFNHNTFTKFPLTGAHVSVPCTSCHVNGQFAGTPTDCASCHLGDFQKTTNPNHVTAGFPQQCQVCHTTTSWTSATFNHSATGFALTGFHTTVACASCHVGGNYKLTAAKALCSACHMTDYNGTTNPNHASAGFPTTCEVCHSTASWTSATFNHSSTGFPLTGFHTTLQCASCHVSGNYKLTSAACITCHQTDYNNTTNPSHKAAGFPQDCSVCHSTIAWSPASFNHNLTGFPLSGFHTTVACASCHVGGNYNLTAANALCSACHMTDYNGTTNPNHKSAGFPTTCDTCHTTTSWLGATFNHNNTPFPLTGAHTTVACTSCHINNLFAGTPTACFSCHAADYNGTTNPNHQAAGFPTTCQICHTTTAWTGATFNHTYFPMNHGGATMCSECHINPTNFAVFSCTNCHQHNQTEMNQQHQGVQGYVYNSANCYQCHPSGGGGG